MSMTKIKGELEIEILTDTTDRDAARKGRRRMENCVQTSQEEMIAGYNGNEASRNDHNGFRDDDYGTTD
jgi:U3 small nucleolar RNA-associated protein 14